MLSAGTGRAGLTSSVDAESLGTGLSDPVEGVGDAWLQILYGDDPLAARQLHLRTRHARDIYLHLALAPSSRDLFPAETSF